MNGIDRFGSTARPLTVVAAVALVAATGGCRRQALADQEQVGAATGEVMAGLDESLDGRAAAAFLTPDELRGPLWRRALDALEPSAYAASCFPSTFSACAMGVRTRQYAQCTLGPSTLDGSVTLTFTRSALCTLITAGDAVTRAAAFTLTGPYGGALAVSSPGGGQTLTKTADGFSYAVGGMERVLTGPGGRTLFDVTTHTKSPFVVTGTSRADLVVVSGTLEVTHALAGYTVSLEASNLTWQATCNCAVSGTLTGSVTAGGGQLPGKSAVVQIKSCGHADVTIDGDTESVTLDRCAGL
jgi:hypothetical protein